MTRSAAVMNEDNSGFGLHQFEGDALGGLRLGTLRSESLDRPARPSPSLLGVLVLVVALVVVRRPRSILDFWEIARRTMRTGFPGAISTVMTSVVVVDVGDRAEDPPIVMTSSPTSTLFSSSCCARAAAAGAGSGGSRRPRP